MKQLRVEDLKVKVFADGADLATMKLLGASQLIKGLTTNPTHMRKSGVTDYRQFAREVLEEISEKPISFEVFSDDLEEMKNQALEIASWGRNVNVKIPITNSFGVSTLPIIQALTDRGVIVNVTAMMTVSQIEATLKVINREVPSYLSLFAGRIADTGRDPLPMVAESLAMMKSFSKAELIWASPRELLNIFQADQVGCHVITVTQDILKKLDFVGYSLEDFSLDTVKMFRGDALSAGFTL
jgi:transaldolase